ncbi:MAG TPA: carboxypeptidase regulatory-like domain-containing protein [Pyrinomonadaceae bacterium]|nr:carboxypeptidase regulatory-like domain-containing protein [Pyrinomonadaceae bacterium]
MRHYLAQACRLTALALLICACAGAAFAQETTGTINGTVKDSTGAVVKGATVTVTDESKRVVVRTVTTGDEGEYSIPTLPVGTYTVTVESPNFKKSVQTGVKLDVNQRYTVDVALEAGNIAEVVTVQADPVTVELTTPAVSTVITGDQARELSINNRNFVQLVTLAPGVTNDLADQVYVGTTNPAGQANTVNISVNGARSSQNTFTVDGADITDRGSNLTIQTYPSVDSIGEFKVSRSLYPAESGSSGGGQINIITRSGGDRFHGDLFEFVRNERLNANDFLTNSSTNPPFGRDSNGKAKRSPFRYNNYGFTVGGPVYFFKFGEGEGNFFKKMDKTFFFFSEEQRRDLRYPTLSATVPDANLRAGIFPIPVCINRNDIAGSTCTGANILPAGTPLPASALNPAAAAYLSEIYNKLPLPNAANFTLISAAINKANFQQEIVKIDHTFTNKLTGFYRYERDKIPTLDVNSLFSSGSGLPGVAPTDTDSPGRAHTAQLTYAASSSMVIEGHYTHAFGAILSHNIGLLALSNSPNPVTLPFANTRDRITSVSGNGFSALTGFGPYDNFSNKNEVGGSLSYIHATHTMKFGLVWSKYRKNENALIGDTTGGNNGIFTAFGTALPAGVTASATNQNLQRWANFLVGNAATFVQGQFDYTANMFQSNWESFAQDEYKFRRNLTLYYGVRYSRFGQPFDENGRLSNFDPSLYNPANAPQVTGAGNRVAGTGNFCNGMFVNAQNVQTAANCTPIASPFGDKITSTSNHDFGPRVGLAWDPFGKGTTSVRTGYGIYHEQVLVGYAEQIIGQNPPYQQNFTITNTRLDNPAAGVTAPPSAAASTIRGIDPNWHTPYMQHWSLDLQHQFGANTLVSVGYYGSKGTHLVGVVEINELPPGLAINSRCATGNNTLQTPGVTTVPCQVAGQGFFAAANPSGFTSTILDQLRPYRGYRSITMLEPRFNSNYHSLQVSATSRFRRDSQVQLAYTWSKNLTDEQNDRTNAPENSFDIHSEYSRAALDRRHVLTINYNYELPFFEKRNDFAGKLLGGWQSSSIITAQSGLPFTATTSSFDASGLGNIPALIAGNRPNAICDPNSGAPRTAQQYFNTSCFQPNPAATATNISNTPGNAQRGSINGPPTYRVDFSLFKNIHFSESMRIQLRGEAFNIFNHTNFRTLSTNVTAANFGAVTAVRDPRTIQLGVKFYF